MLLVFDIGNSNIVMGAYDGKKLYRHWRISTEYGKDMTVIATGGLARMIAEESSTIDKTDHFLTLTGLRVLYERNAASRKGYLERLKNKPSNNL